MGAGAAWVLIIEDVRDHAELWSDVCADLGLNAMMVPRGIDGWRRARDTRPVLVLLDLGLPDIDGWEVCRRLKADDATRDIPIVVVTARDEPGGARRAAQAGCAAYLTKPCRPADLVAVIRKVLGDRQSV
ncbi:MAG: response regulator [Acidobacteria bacterium]|nr:response regulator [Acidobacteriota bacterium]